VRVEQLGGAREFLSRTAEFRAADPVMTNLLGSIASSVAGGRAYDRAFWWAVADDRGRVVGCALRTAPHRLIVSPMPAEAAAALGPTLSAVDPRLPGCSGPRQVVEAVVGALVPPRALRVTMTDVVYVLGDYTRPRPAPGGPRRAVLADLELLVAWHLQFGIDVGLPTHDVQASVLDRLDQAGLWLWEVDGVPVAMAGHAVLVATPAEVVGRIGPVYTPVELRGRGYGSAVTAAVVEELLPRCAAVMLFADAANPASNGIYRALGFRAAGELVETELSPVRR
jgi:predicted GNAT family acetyltransferase